jgi:hypothetical protein
MSNVGAILSRTRRLDRTEKNRAGIFVSLMGMNRISDNRLVDCRP